MDRPTRPPLAAVLAALAGLGGLQGCLTAREVKEIVEAGNAQQNAQLLDDLPVAVEASDLSGATPLIPGDGPPAEWQQTVARIEEFAARHPDQPKIVNPLRMRQASLLLQNGQPNLAGAAFDQVDPSHLSNERDQKLYAARETLVWWYGASKVPSWSTTEQERARAALDTLSAACDPLPLPADADACRFLERTRMQIANLLARQVDDPASVAAPALARYLAQFRDDEWPAIRAWHCDAPAGATRDALRQARWYDYVPDAVRHARTACSDPAAGPVCGAELPPPAVAALACR